MGDEHAIQHDAEFTDDLDARPAARRFRLVVEGHLVEFLAASTVEVKSNRWRTPFVLGDVGTDGHVTANGDAVLLRHPGQDEIVELLRSTLLRVLLVLGLAAPVDGANPPIA